ncbi:ComEC/Rec2 family competence protein [Solibacillus sp. FSL K6-1523]|uniref:ComEC/Rec2 family competence protein n=1 Tax=Solibacillus sp. FSL K6-1523 TaxID=2921471 RepID=UPI0030FAF289
MKKVYILFLLLFIAGCSGQITSQEGNFNVHAFKVGKADSLLVSHQGQHILIDAGEEDDGEKIVAYLQSKNIQKLDALIITHFDKDHVGGADSIVRALQIEHIYVPNYESNSKQTRKFLEAIDEKQLTVETITDVQDLSVGKAMGKIYPPKQTNLKGDNDQSLVVSLSYGETSFLFTGDIEAPRIAELLTDSSISMPHTFLKVPHHGRFNRQTTALVEAVRPTYALITSSDKNPEHSETVAALEAVGAQIWTTRKGDVEFISDGEKIEVTE